ncbi:MAG: PspA/IM30 family protein [Planctomycetes bacterium]|nr:PspA/IM30 family protein [Planctomycetota bacterium]
MSFFSRLSDIVSCKLDELVAHQADPASAMARIISEIEEGLAGARRSVAAAGNSEERLQSERAERQKQAAWWANQARQELAADHEDDARQALMRKKETEDLVAGIEQQIAAASSTRAHLTTTMRAIEARLAEARRIQQERLAQGTPVASARSETVVAETFPPAVDTTRAAQIEAELEALKRELKK